MQDVWELWDHLADALGELNLSFDWHGRSGPQHEGIDLFVHGPWTNQPFGIQITVERKCKWQIRRFVEAALETTDRGRWLYVEVIAGRKQSAYTTARKLAHAIREAVTRYRDFGPHAMLGLVVRANPRSKVPGVDKFRLEDAVGRGWLERHLEERREEAEAEAARRATVRREEEELLQGLCTLLPEPAPMQDNAAAEADLQPPTGPGPARARSRRPSRWWPPTLPPRPRHTSPPHAFARAARRPAYHMRLP